MLIPFTRQWAEKAEDVSPTRPPADLDLFSDLCAELPYILGSAVKVFPMVYEGGLEPPEAVVAATEEYREEQDKGVEGLTVWKEFKNDALGFYSKEEDFRQTGEGAKKPIKMQDVLTHFKEWAAAKGKKGLGPYGTTAAVKKLLLAEGAWASTDSNYRGVFGVDLDAMYNVPARATGAEAAEVAAFLRASKK